PGFVEQVEHKLRAYTWNVVHRYEVELVIDVREIGTDGRGQRARFSSRTGFARESCAGCVVTVRKSSETLLELCLCREVPFLTPHLHRKSRHDPIKHSCNRIRATRCCMGSSPVRPSGSAHGGANGRTIQ